MRNWNESVGNQQKHVQPKIQVTSSFTVCEANFLKVNLILNRKLKQNGSLSSSETIYTLKFHHYIIRLISTPYFCIDNIVKKKSQVKF